MPTPQFDQAGFDKFCTETRRDYAGVELGGVPADPEQQIARCRRFYCYITCSCERRVYLGNFTNTCDCGRDYNASGSLLAPRSQWGEETGESADDILRAEAAGFPEVDY